MTASQPSTHSWTSYDEFYRAEYPRVVAYLAYHGYSRHTAEEAAQNAMVEVHRSWDTIRKPHVWARKAAHHHAGRLWRRTRREFRLPDGYDIPATADPRLACVIERNSWLVELINELPEHLVSVFALHLDDFGTREIAQCEGISIRTVQKYLKQAREILQRRLADTGRWEGNE